MDCMYKNNAYVVCVAHSWQFCIWEKKRNYKNNGKGVLVTKIDQCTGWTAKGMFKV